MRIQWGKLVFAEVICFAAGGVGSLVTFSQIPTWYMHLTKPFYTPPTSVFGPVWTLLYFLQGISLYLILKGRANTRQIRLGLLFFYAQLLLNALWSILFFGLHATALSLFEILVLGILILLSLLSFAKVSKVAAWLLFPYLLWVSFASLLNLGIVILNH